MFDVKIEKAFETFVNILALSEHQEDENMKLKSRLSEVIHSSLNRESNIATSLGEEIKNLKEQNKALQ